MQRLKIGDISTSHLHNLPTTIIIGTILASLDGQELGRKIPHRLMVVLTFMKLKMSNGTLDWFLSISLYKIFNAENCTRNICAVKHKTDGSTHMIQLTGGLQGQTQN